MKRLDLIISAIKDSLKDYATDSYGNEYRVCCGSEPMFGHDRNCKLTQAYAAARELRDMKPTHYVDHKNERNVVHYSLWKSFDDCGILKERYTTPLYALDEETL
jgi:hypothetical protein